MSNAIKLALFVLLLLFGFSAFMALSALSQKSVLEKSKAELEQKLIETSDRESKLLAQKKQIEQELQAAKDSEAKIRSQYNSLNEQISTLTKERDDWKGRVESVRKERDDLMAKLQEQPSISLPLSLPATPEPSVAMPSGEVPDNYLAAILKEKASLGVKIKELEDQAMADAVALEELRKKNSDVDLELGHLKNQNDELARKIKYSEDLANTLSIELAREKNDKRYVAERVDKFKEENLNLRSQIKELSSAKVSLEKTIARLNEDRDKITQRLAETESVIQNRIDEIVDIKSNIDKRLKTDSGESKEIELPPIIVSAPGKETAAQEAGTAGLDGRVLSINPDNNFVVVNLGEEAGIQLGDSLGVYRGSKYIAGLEVIQVRKDICAADIKQKNAKIQVGDAVK